MAQYRFEVKSGSKGSAAEHGAYISRHGRHEKRHEDLVEQGSGNMPGWTAGDPRTIWKLADKYERANGAAYREMVISIPQELTPPQSHELVEEMVRELVGPKPYQYAVHAPISSLAGERNPHLHLMFTDRIPDGIERSPELIFRRFNPQSPHRGGWKKDSGGMNRLALRDHVIEMRKRCAAIQNRVLAKYGHDARVDHRTLKEQRIDRSPERHLGQAAIRRMSVREKAQHVASRRESQQKAASNGRLERTARLPKSRK